MLRLPQPGVPDGRVRRRARPAGSPSPTTCSPSRPSTSRRSSTRTGTRSGRARAPAGRSTPPGTLLFTLELAGYKPDETTAAVVEYLLKRDADRDHWRTSSNRPPSEASDFTTTYLAVRGLRTWGTPEQKERIAKRVEAARDWLLKTPAKDTEDRVFRLLGPEGGRGRREGRSRAAAWELLEPQRPDGGWGQTRRDAERRLRDRHGPGGAAPRPAGWRPTTRRTAAAWRSCCGRSSADGSWYVKSRSKPFQPYYESGFPHEKDQFISSPRAAGRRPPWPSPARRSPDFLVTHAACSPRVGRPRAVAPGPSRRLHRPAAGPPRLARGPEVRPHDPVEPVHAGPCVRRPRSAVRARRGLDRTGRVRPADARRSARAGSAVVRDDRRLRRTGSTSPLGTIAAGRRCTTATGKAVARIDATGLGTLGSSARIASSLTTRRRKRSRSTTWRRAANSGRWRWGGDLRRARGGAGRQVPVRRRREGGSRLRHGHVPRGRGHPGRPAELDPHRCVCATLRTARTRGADPDVRRVRRRTLRPGRREKIAPHPAETVRRRRPPQVLDWSADGAAVFDAAVIEVGTGKTVVEVRPRWHAAGGGAGVRGRVRPEQHPRGLKSFTPTGGNSARDARCRRSPTPNCHDADEPVPGRGRTPAMPPVALTNPTHLGPAVRAGRHRGPRGRRSRTWPASGEAHKLPPCRSVRRRGGPRHARREGGRRLRSAGT